MRQTLRLPAALQRLDEFRVFALDCANASGLPDTLGGKLELILEELLVNVISYAYPDGAGDVELDCGLNDQGLFALTIRDWGAPFDPLAAKAPDIDATVDDRPIGGLGIFFVKEMSDGVSYRRADDANELTVLFALAR